MQQSTLIFTVSIPAAIFIALLGSKLAHGVGVWEEIYHIEHKVGHQSDKRNRPVVFNDCCQLSQIAQNGEHNSQWNSALRHSFAWQVEKLYLREFSEYRQRT
jgi:hypothetical protein